MKFLCTLPWYRIDRKLHTRIRTCVRTHRTKEQNSFSRILSINVPEDRTYIKFKVIIIRRKRIIKEDVSQWPCQYHRREDQDRIRTRDREKADSRESRKVEVGIK